MPMFWKSKTLLAKIETTYGTDSAPSAAANAVLALNVSFAPMEGQDVNRNLELPAMGAVPSIPVGIYTTLTFEVELVGSGTLGTAPAWGPLLRMCGVAEVVTAGTKVEYSPITDNHESGSIYFAIDTIKHVMLGCRGTAVITVNAQGIPVIRFTFFGLFTMPATAAKVVPVFTAWKTPSVATKANTPTFTIGGTSFTMRSFSFDLGCDVQPRMLVGTEQMLIVDKAEKISTQVEAISLATYNPYQIAQNQTTQAIQLVHGTTAATRVQLDYSKAQQARLTGYAVEQNIVEWPLNFTPLQTSGNDQWKLSLL